MINKKQFCDVIKAMQDQHKTDEKVSTALELISDTWVMINTKNKLYGALDTLLGIIMNDKDQYISWWQYEGVEKKIWITKPKKREIILKTAGQLYDFLIEFYGEDSDEQKL